jgi:16S rRNA (cytidine1402-2'-O)-methyltransferase
MLHLLPNLLDEGCDPKKVFPAYLWEVMDTLDFIIVETPKVARAFFKHFSYKTLLALPMKEYNEHTKEAELSTLLEKGKICGYLSDAGLPCIADPGYRLVEMARKCGIAVHAHVGPSSPLLALMLSGLNSASFTFYGYFPRELKDIHALMSPKILAHVFIETPYRNEQTLAKLLTLLKPTTKLSVALDLTGEKQEVHTYSVEEWKKKRIDLQKRPAIYIISMATSS